MVIGFIGPWEMVFCAVVTLLAYRGLTDHQAIGFAWLVHTGGDLAHDVYGSPIIPFAPASSCGCFICDPILAAWYLLGAPDLCRRFRTSKAVASYPVARSSAAGGGT